MSESLVANVVRFTELLRLGALDVHPGRTADLVMALERVGVRNRNDAKAALRSLLVHRHEDIGFFDEAFDRFWRAPSHGAGAPLLFSLGERPRVVAAPGVRARVEFEPAADRAAGAARLVAAAWSASESLRTRDFGELTATELARAEAIVAALPWRLGIRRTRRWTRAAKGAVDLRPIVRSNMRHGGELIDVPHRERRSKPRPIVVLADVSGSMERYARVLLQLVCGMTARSRSIESFAFATRLTRLTRLIRHRGAAGAFRAVAREVQDWGGGTRIGEALRAFNVHWARRVVRNGPVVLIVSDGWDRGDPDQLARELARVRRSCHRLVWLNPLLGSATYEPLTRGMRAALPFVDDFLPAHNLASLEQLAAYLEALPPRRHAH